MSIKIAQQRINSAREATAKLLADYHHGRIEGEDLEIQLGYIRNQCDIILDDLSECPTSE